ncbi:MAG: prolipoprotein diacylglyceryl transferase [Propionibacteriaceae bacterium]|jgi:prolipoprotein diacylglyceryl transferase|nr:prolipoprotein diacylglyceryl transferase [Propionibacteriaceae bacterium]
MIPLFIPSPSQGVWYLGPIPLRGYALSILAGIVIAFIIVRRRWIKMGEPAEQMENITLASIVCGILGARVYWVIIEWHRYFGAKAVEPWYHIFYMWEGGLGIWGGIVGGFLTAWLLCRHYKVSFFRLADAVAPAFLLAQGIGRLGNWWNQELYGLPTTLPWALEIDPAHRVPGYAQYATFHPTFLYEMAWSFLGVAVILLLEKKLRLGRGKVFATYIVWYATGRFLNEFLRIDPVDTFWGLRVNSWATLAGWLFGVVLLVWLIKNRPGPNEVKASKTSEESEPDSEPDTTDDTTEDATDAASDEESEAKSTTRED